jgi:hypothetical protein
MKQYRMSEEVINYKIEKAECTTLQTNSSSNAK